MVGEKALKRFGAPSRAVVVCLASGVAAGRRAVCRAAAQAHLCVQLLHAALRITFDVRQDTGLLLLALMPPLPLHCRARVTGRSCCSAAVQAGQA